MTTFSRRDDMFKSMAIKYNKAVVLLKSITLKKFMTIRINI